MFKLQPPKPSRWSCQVPRYWRSRDHPSKKDMRNWQTQHNDTDTATIIIRFQTGLFCLWYVRYCCGGENENTQYLQLYSLKTKIREDPQNDNTLTRILWWPSLVTSVILPAAGSTCVHFTSGPTYLYFSRSFSPLN